MLWKLIKTLYWVFVCLLIAASAAGLASAFGGGDARHFYGLVLCSSLGLAFFSLGVWAAWDGHWHFVFVGTGLAGMTALVTVLCGCHKSVYVNVRNGHTGVFVKDGRVLEERLPPGVHWRSPFVEVREQRTDPAESIFRVEARDAAGDKIWVSVLVHYQVPEDRLPRAVLDFPQGVGDDLVGEVIEDETQRLMVRYRSADSKLEKGEMESALETAVRPRLDERCVVLLRVSIAGVLRQ